MRAFLPARYAGGASFTFELAHASAYLDRIGGDHAAFGAPVVEHHRTAVAFGEFESAEIYPGAAAALLVHDELAGAAEVADGVVCGIAAVLKRLPGHVDGIAAALFYGRRPYCTCAYALSAACGHARRSGLERVVGEAVAAPEVRETLAGVLPWAALGIAAALAHASFARTVECRVVVGDDLPPLRVALPGRDDVGSGVLEHGYQIGEHE